jgi:ABC-type dipeptide/oligopeptide/nickel transport system permease component
VLVLDHFSARGKSGLDLAGVSIPGFWLAAMMSYYVGFKLGWFPTVATCRSPRIPRGGCGT